MENFMKMNNVADVDSMYGKEVYVTISPDKPDGSFIYKGTLLGYGAYGKNPKQKTFCVYVDRGDGYSFLDFFLDQCFKSREDYEEFRQQRKEQHGEFITVDRLSKILDGEESHIEVKVKVGDEVYPISGITDQAKTVMEPALILKAETEKGKAWEK